MIPYPIFLCLLWALLFLLVTRGQMIADVTGRLLICGRDYGGGIVATKEECAKVAVIEYVLLHGQPNLGVEGNKAEALVEYILENWDAPEYWEYLFAVRDAARRLYDQSQQERREED